MGDFVCGGDACSGVAGDGSWWWWARARGQAAWVSMTNTASAQHVTSARLATNKLLCSAFAVQQWWAPAGWRTQHVEQPDVKCLAADQLCVVL